jgi:hypothetical protein
MAYLLERNVSAERYSSAGRRKSRPPWTALRGSPTALGSNWRPAIERSITPRASRSQQDFRHVGEMQAFLFFVERRAQKSPVLVRGRAFRWMFNLPERAEGAQ